MNYKWTKYASAQKRYKIKQKNEIITASKERQLLTKIKFQRLSKTYQLNIAQTICNSFISLINSHHCYVKLLVSQSVSWAKLDIVYKP